VKYKDPTIEQEDEVRAAIFYIREDQWEHFLAMMTDSDNNFESWNEWKATVDKTTVLMLSEGVAVINVEVDLDEFRAWCQGIGAEMNGQSRARYATEAMKNKET